MSVRRAHEWTTLAALLAVASGGCVEGRRTNAIETVAPAAPISTARPPALARARESLELARTWSAAGSDPRAPLLDAQCAYAEALTTAPNDPASLLEATYVEQWLVRVGDHRDADLSL